MWVFLIVVAVLAYFIIPEVLSHRERMAELKRKNDNK